MMQLVRLKVLWCVCMLSSVAFLWAQPFRWPAEYAATSRQGGTVNLARLDEVITFNPVHFDAAADTTLFGAALGGPDLVYRDWIGNRSFQRDDGTWNLFWASRIEEVVPLQEYIITLREGWHWSDGDVMDVDDVIIAYTIHGDLEVASNHQYCTVVEEEPVEVEKISQYQYRLRLPKPIVNPLSRAYCGVLASHIFGPVYEAEGAEGVRALWGGDADIATIVSAGPYILKEYRPGEKIVFERNPYYGEVVKAADGTPLPGPEQLVSTIVEDTNVELSLVLSGKVDAYYPTDDDKVAAVMDALDHASISGQLFDQLGASTLVDFITYNFNNTNPCKAAMFRDVRFRQAMAILIDRQELVEMAVGGAATPAKDLSTPASAPFGAPFLEDFPFDPEGALELLADMGFIAEDDDGVLMNPDTGCRVEFELRFNSGNTRRNQEALTIAQKAADYGVKIHPMATEQSVWISAITDDLDYDVTGHRTVDYDAQIWGLAGSDVDNPSFENVLGLQQNLNAWNKSKIDVEPWEIQLDGLTKQMVQTLDLNARINVYYQRAEIMREYLPITPLISPNFYFYTGLSNMWPENALDALSIEDPYRYGNFLPLLMK